MALSMTAIITACLIWGNLFNSTLLQWLYLGYCVAQSSLIFIHWTPALAKQKCPLNWNQVLPQLFSTSEASLLLSDFLSQDLPLLLWVLLSRTALSLDFTERHARASGQDLALRTSETRSEKCHRLDPRLLTKQAAAGGGKQKQFSKWYAVPEVMCSELRKKGKSNQEMCLPWLLTLFQLITKKGTLI